MATARIFSNIFPISDISSRHMKSKQRVSAFLAYPLRLFQVFLREKYQTKVIVQIKIRQEA